MSFVLSGESTDDLDAGLGYGNQVRVDHHEGYFSFYSHLDEVFVRAGQMVESGQTLGTMGRTGADGGRLMLRAPA